MQGVALFVATIAAVIHVFVFWMESLAFRRPRVFKRFLIANEADAATLSPVMFNQGFYNLFLALGCGGGVALTLLGHRPAGPTLFIFCCSMMSACGVVLVLSNRNLARAAAVQFFPPFLAVVAYTLHIVLKVG